jgi:hypothetical protein
MGSIQPVGQHVPNVASQRPVQPAANAGAGAATAGVGAVAAGSSTSVQTSNVTMVQSQVNSMMSSIGGGLENNQMLKMVIGLMIMQALLSGKGGGGGGGEQQQMAAGMLLGMLEGAGSNVQSQMFSMQSATNTVQIQNSSTVLETSQAALAPTATEGDPDQAGCNIDLSA